MNIDLVQNRYTSVYRKDYVQKKIARVLPHTSEQEFKDPINEGYRRYLYIEGNDLILPDEDGQKYCKKFKEDHANYVKNHFENELDKNTLLDNEILDKRSEYQVEYCDIGKDLEMTRNKTDHRHVILPDDVLIPVTTYTSAYREPTTIYTKALDSVDQILPQHNLGTDAHLMKILGVTTGESEYMDEVGKLGSFIVKNQMHGKITYPPCTCAKHHPVK